MQHQKKTTKNTSTIQKNASKTTQTNKTVNSDSDMVQNIVETPEQLSPDAALYLQRTLGNRFVTQLIQRNGEEDDGVYTQTEVNKDHYALWEALEMIKAINRDADLDESYYHSKTIPNYVGRLIWYASLKDQPASQRLHHLQNARNKLQPIVKRYSTRSSFIPSQLKVHANSCRKKLEKKAAEENIVNREEELKDSSFGLGTLSEDQQRLTMIASVKEVQGIFANVKAVGDKGLKITDTAVKAAKDVLPDVVDKKTISELAEDHLAGKDVSQEALAPFKSGEKKITDIKTSGEKLGQTLGDVGVALKGIGYALSLTDIIAREDALDKVLNKYPGPVSNATNISGKVFEVMQYGVDVSTVIVRRVAERKGGEAMQKVLTSLDQLSQASKVLGALGASLSLIRDLSILVDDDATDKDKESAAWSAVANTATLGFLAAGTKGAAYASPLGWALFMAQIMVNQTGEHVYWKSNQDLISGFSKQVFSFIDDGATHLSSSARDLKATNEVMQSGKESTEGKDNIDPWEEDYIDAHVGEEDVRDSAKFLDHQMTKFVDIVLNPNSDHVRTHFTMFKPGGYNVIREYFGEFDTVLTSTDFDSMDSETLQETVEEQLDTAEDLILTYRMFRMQKGAIAQAMGTTNDENRDAKTQEILENKSELAKLFN